MKPATFLAICLLASAPAAVATDYPLSFTPISGYQGLVVAGYAFQGNTVVGNCSYYTVQAGSGRGGGTTTTRYDQTCTWDMYGNLQSITTGAPTPPAPLYTDGTRTIYAVAGGGAYTGTDTRLPHGGFVNTPGSHYSWLTPNDYQVLRQMPQNFTLTLKSDGDAPLNVRALNASALHASATLQGTTCIGALAAGSTCSVTVAYDPTQLSSATLLAYDTLTVSVASDAGQAQDFVQSYTIVLTQPLDCLFNWAERTYPAYFSPAGAASAIYAQYYYRYYPGTGNYVGASSPDNHIWVLGPVSGNNLLDVGPITGFMEMAGCSP